MKALMKTAVGVGNMEIRDIPEPTPGKGEVKIKVENAGVCGSDIHIYHSNIAIPLQYPVVTGHEFSGVVDEVGEGVVKWKKGDRVTSETAYSFCNACEHCKTGFYNLCANRRTLGYWYNGAFASFTVVPEDRIHALPSNVDFITGAMIEPLACTTHAVLELTAIKSTDVVAVLGPGAIGLMAAQLAKAEGATVIVAGVMADAKRMALAKEMGADYCIDISNEDLPAFVNRLTNNMGADVVLECSGSAAALASALEIIKKQGRLTQIGLFGKPIEVNFEKICTKELKVTGSFGSTWTAWEKAISLVSSGQIRLNPLMTHRMGLSDWKQAFEMFENKEGIKFILYPEA